MSESTTLTLYHFLFCYIMNEHYLDKSILLFDMLKSEIKASVDPYQVTKY